MELIDIIVVSAATLMGSSFDGAAKSEEFREQALLEAQRLWRTAIKLKHKDKLDL